MPKTVVALYDNFETAERAVRRLIDEGFWRENISLVATSASGDYHSYQSADLAALEQEGVPGGPKEGLALGAQAGAGLGALIGGLGGLLVGLGALTLPGLGPVVAAGPLLAAMNTLLGAGLGALAGGAAGGLLGALVRIGVPQHQAELYAEAVRRGGVLVTTTADDDRADYARSLLDEFSPVDVQTRSVEWRREGWLGYDPNAVAPGSTAGAPPGDAVNEASQTYAQRDVQGSAGAFESDWFTHYNENLAHTGFDYAYFQPAYFFGYNAANDPGYRGLDWEAAEPQLRARWETEQPGVWDEIRASVRHAWERSHR